MTAQPHIEPAPESVHWSKLSKMLISPKACKHAAEADDQDTEARGFGRLVHLATLQPDRFESHVLVEPDFGNLRTNDGKARRAAWYAKIAPGVEVKTTDDVPRAKAVAGRNGFEVCSPEERALALACAEAVRAHPAASALLQGAQTEVELEWERLGILCGGRIDILRPNGAGVVDLKTTRRATLRQLLRDLADFVYHGQLAFYHDGGTRVGRIRKDAERPHIIAVQGEPPHDVAVVRFPEETLQAGIALGDRLLRTWIGCSEANIWPGMCPDVVDWYLEPWAPGMAELAREEEEDW